MEKKMNFFNNLKKRFLIFLVPLIEGKRNSKKK